MEKRMDHIYYYSIENTEQLYKKHFNIIYDEQHLEEGDTSKKSGLIKAGWLGVGLQGGHEDASHALIKNIRKESPLERALNLFNSASKLDIKSLIEGERLSNVYMFQLPLKFSETFNRTSTSIVAIYEDEYLKISGSTSYENWPSKSLLNNLLFVTEEDGILCDGLILPIKKRITEDDRVELVVQYLIIGKEGSFGNSH
ncbi:hypothetical protein [Paenibacillus taichungensis]